MWIPFEPWISGTRVLRYRGLGPKRRELRQLIRELRDMRCDIAVNLYRAATRGGGVRMAAFFRAVGASPLHHWPAHGRRDRRHCDNAFWRLSGRTQGNRYLTNGRTQG